MFFSRRAARPHNALTFKDLTSSSDKLQKVNVLFSKGRSPVQCFDFLKILPTVRINCKRWMFFSRRAARPHNALTFKDLNNSSDKLQKVNVLFPKGRLPAQCFRLLKILPTVQIHCKRWMFFSRRAARPHNALTFKDLTNSSNKLQKVNVFFPKGRSSAQCFDFLSYCQQCG